MEDSGIRDREMELLRDGAIALAAAPTDTGTSTKQIRLNLGFDRKWVRSMNRYDIDT